MLLDVKRMVAYRTRDCEWNDVLKNNILNGRHKGSSAASAWERYRSLISFEYVKESQFKHWYDKINKDFVQKAVYVSNDEAAFRQDFMRMGGDSAVVEKSGRKIWSNTDVFKQAAVDIKDGKHWESFDDFYVSRSVYMQEEKHHIRNIWKQLIRKEKFCNEWERKQEAKVPKEIGDSRYDPFA